MQKKIWMEGCTCREEDATSFLDHWVGTTWFLNHGYLGPESLSCIVLCMAVVFQRSSRSSLLVFASCLCLELARVYMLIPQDPCNLWVFSAMEIVCWASCLIRLLVLERYWVCSTNFLRSKLRCVCEDPHLQPSSIWTRVLSEGDNSILCSLEFSIILKRDRELQPLFFWHHFEARCSLDGEIHLCCLLCHSHPLLSHYQADFSSAPG